MDINECFLRGRIGQDFKFAKTKDAREFATFSIAINNIASRKWDKTAHDNIVYLRIMVFDTRLVQYLHKVNAKANDMVNVFARLNSHKVNQKGVEYSQIDIVANDISIIKIK